MLQEVIQKFEKLKIACQELQRDVTMRRCLARKDEIQRLQDHIEGLQQQLEAHFTILDTKQQALETVGSNLSWSLTGQILSVIFNFWCLFFLLSVPFSFFLSFFSFFFSETLCLSLFLFCLFGLSFFFLFLFVVILR